MKNILVVGSLFVASLASAAPKPTAEEAKAFVARVNADLKKLYVAQSTAEWIKATYITDDTERAAASANEEMMAYVTPAIKQAIRFVGLKLDPETERMLYLIRMAAAPLPGPSDAKKRAELATLADKLEGIYGKGKYCKNGKCRDLQELENVLRKSRNYDELLDAWSGWHSIARPMRPMYERLVELGNQGAHDVGFANLGELWRAGYDMSPAEFEADTDRLWLEVKPLYDDLHCYVRKKLAEKYGKDKVPEHGAIPAHLLGNMWAQEWANIYPLVEPYPGESSLDVDAGLKKQNYDPIKMVKTAEGFFTSLGLDPLPKTFWERSQFTRPRDREVVCHASAWDVQFDNDLRIKMCIELNGEDLTTLHHELGHDYYFHAYYKLPVLFQQGANDGFHEAIGDALTLSITPNYLKQLGLIDAIPKNDHGLINVQMKRALEGVALLPWTKLVDQWRWDVFSGKTPPGKYNEAWWALRKKYQGVAPATARGEDNFDPGAKYHIPANVPYTRYFLARILQYQFHRALCKAAGQKEPLHECSIYGNKQAGEKFQAMLKLGASRPWPEALYALTGQRTLDATAIVDYYKPLAAWLKKQNQGAQCGW